MEYKLLINGQWVDGGDQLEVTNKYTQEVFAAVSMARQEDVDAAITAARRAAPLMADMPAYQRAEILADTAALIGERKAEFAETIAQEAGKALKYARVEVERSAHSRSRPRRQNGCTAKLFPWTLSQLGRVTSVFGCAVR